MPETMILYVDLTEAQRQGVDLHVTVLEGRRLDEPLAAHPDWLAVVRYDDGPTEKHVLYAITTAGLVLESIQRDTLEEALDEADQLTNVARDEWRRCEVALPDGYRMPRSLVNQKRVAPYRTRLRTRIRAGAA
jgi:hypothetical protein